MWWKSYFDDREHFGKLLKALALLGWNYYFGNFLETFFKEDSFWSKVAKIILAKLNPLFCFCLALATALGCFFSLFSRFLKDGEEMVLQQLLIS